MSASDESSIFPVVPQPVLKALFDAALDFQKMAPWDWMREDDTFGIVDPSTGTLHVAVVLGKQDGAPGFVLYRGERGYRYLFRQHDDPGSPLNPDLSMEEDSLMLEFVSKSKLQLIDIEMFEAAGFALPKPKKGKKAGGFPQFTSRLPCHLPFPPEATECKLLTTALVLAQAFSAVVNEDPDFYGKRPYEEIPVYSRVGDREDSPWKLGWTTLDFSPRPGPPAAELPKPGFEQVASMPVADQAEWELETYFPPTLIRKPKRPFFPRASIIADVETGRFLDIELAHPDEPEGNHAARSLIETMIETGSRPSSLYVCSPVLAEALWPMCESLGIRLRFRALLTGTPPIRAYLAERFAKEDGQAPIQE